MINIDTRFLDQVNESELWLVCQLLRRFNRNNQCWPSNKAILKDTGWEIKKLTRVKNSLIEKGILSVTPRIENGRPASNIYQIESDLIGVYVPAKDFPMEDTSQKRGVPNTPQNVGGITPQNAPTEVLISEVLVSISDSKESGQLSLTGTEPVHKKKPQSEYPEYAHFIDTWVKTYPTIGIQMPRDGAKIKSLIRQTRQQLQARGLDASQARVVEFWVIFVANLHRTWYGGKNLAKIDSAYPEIIHELEHGKQGKQPTSKSTEALSYFDALERAIQARAGDQQETG